MSSKNLVILCGNVGSEPEVRTSAKGTLVAKVSLATNDGWGDREKTNWHRLTCFGKRAEIVERYVHKGDQLLVEGRLDYSTSTAEDGSTRYWTDVLVDDLVLMGRRDGAVETDERVGAPVEEPDDSEPLPF